MGKITEVSIINSNTIRLEVDCKKGDEIDLLSISKVDNSILQRKISENQDQLYLQKINEVKKNLENEKQTAIFNATEDLKNQNTILTTRMKNLESEIKSTISLDYEKRISVLKEDILKLQANITMLNANKENEIEIALKTKENESNKVINDLEKQIIVLKENLNNKEQNIEKTINVAILEKVNEFKDKLSEKEDIINNLKLSKSGMNVKQLGEELEKWCDNEFNLYSLTGFQTCTWEKDNLVIKDENEAKGSKADYVFKVYATENKKENELLSSVVCEMKNEDPLSKNKKKNSDYFLKLNKDREKKKCEYALLVSELEWEQINDVPIKKVSEYDKMYIVRPQYFITFLSIVASLGLKFKDLLLERNQNIENFKDSQEIIDEFEKFKSELVDKQLVRMEKEVGSIIDNANNIKNYSDKIVKSAETVTLNIIENIKKKIDNFNIQKIVKKINKIDGDK